MTEKSFLWADSTGGDESPISEADTADLFLAIMGGYGVVRGYQNELACTVSGLNVLTNTGWGVSRTGYLYRNTSSKSTTITTPSIGTTGHRLVLRENTTSNTVRITDVSSADGTSAIPAAAATDVTLATFTITTLGVITLTDAREYSGQDVFDGIRQLFRNRRRRLVAEYSAGAQPSKDGTTNLYTGLWGTGCAAAASNGNVAVSSTAVGTQAYDSWDTGTAVGVVFGSAVAGSTTVTTCVAPSKNARMLVHWFPGSSNANLSTSMGGFAASASATANGAYLRANTTGNLFFVTRQGGSETTTDLGVRPTSLTSYEIYTDDGGVTWYCRDIATNAIVATHTTNVPTAGTALGHFLYGVSASGALNAFNLGYYRVECDI